MTTKAKIDWATNHHTAQIYNSGVELALCSDDNKQIGTFVFCKDFFQDAIVVFLHGGVCGIYGYAYDPSKQPACPEKNLKVLIANAADPKLREKIPGIPDFLHQIEAKLGCQKTIVEECEAPPDKYKNGVWLLTADPCWMHSPPLLSCWTLLARNALCHTPGESYEATIDKIISGKVTAAQTHDQTYITHGKPGLDLILSKGVEALFGKMDPETKKRNYPKDKGGRTMHHYSGIVSYGSKMAQPHFPHWVYPEKGSNPPGVCFS